jgi:hypothetical protein
MKTFGSEGEEVAGGGEPVGGSDREVEGLEDRVEREVDGSVGGIEQFFPEEHDGDAVDEAGDVEEGSVEGDAAAFLAEEDGEGEGAGDGEGEAEHHVDGVDQVGPEFLIVHESAEVFAAGVGEGGDVLEVPVGERCAHREEDGAGGEEEEAEEVGEEENECGEDVVLETGLHGSCGRMDGGWGFVNGERFGIGPGTARLFFDVESLRCRNNKFAETDVTRSPEIAGRFTFGVVLIFRK